MMEAIKDITSVLMLALVIFQMILLGYLMYTTHVRFKEEKKTWKRAEKMEEELIKSLHTPAIASSEDKEENKQ
ncbi:MAG: hypothetical protein IKB64_10040 [Paludibacteraceae bacterium]|nr:hypothetical protein [Paludibacteraceae bacterium]